jgi:parallel beta-helix repeat protein
MMLIHSVLVKKCQVRNTGIGGHGIVATGSSEIAIVGNPIRACGDGGIEVQTGTGNRLVKNAISNAGYDGFNLDGGGHRLVNNQARRSAECGLRDSAGAGANSYRKNRFGKKCFG